MTEDEKKEKVFGRIAVERGLVTREQLDECERKRQALLKQKKKKVVRLGEVMMQAGCLTREQALGVLKETHLRMGAKPRIGGYELERLLGKGAMGMVYRAQQLSMQRRVALKLLSRELSANEEFVKRFMREARTTAKLNHVNIINAIDVGESNGYHYFAMEYVDGKTLERVLKRQGAMPEPRVVELAVQIVQGLEHASQHGIIHRDIKPANIMLTKEGVPKIADMGLAILASKESSEHMTGTGIAVGTPYYMAPEQVEGKGNVDFRADIYALGATMYEMLTGKKPFDGANVPAIMAKRLYEDPPIASDGAENVGRRISAVVYKMMARDPKGRYQDFPPLIEDLRRVGEGKAPSCMKGLPDSKPAPAKAKAPPARGRQRPTRPRTAAHKRVMMVYGAVGGGLALLLAIIVFVWKYGGGLTGPTHPSPNLMDPKVWEPFSPIRSDGDKARDLWKTACKLHLALDGVQSDNTEELVRVRLAYRDITQKYPKTAYAALAQIRLKELERK